MHDCLQHGETSSSTTQTLDETFFTAERSLHHAVAEDSLDRVRRILSSSRGRIDETDGSGWTAVLYARSSAMLRLLADAGADLNAVTPAGQRSLLHRCVFLVEDEAVHMIPFLLERKISDKDDADGLTAHQLAQKHGKTRLAALLDPDRRDGM